MRPGSTEIVKDCEEVEREPVDVKPGEFWEVDFEEEKGEGFVKFDQVELEREGKEEEV